MEGRSKDTEKVLADEILAEAKRQAEDVVRAAEAEAKATVGRAVSEAEKAHAAALREVDQRVARDAEIAEAGLKHLQRKQRLAAQGQLLAEAFDKALERLRSRQGFDNRAVLRLLAVDAIEGIPGDTVTLVLSPADASLGAGLVPEVADAVRKKSGRAVTVRLSDRPGAFEGGVMAISADGSQCVDNSFAGRLKRLESELRFEVADVLFGKDQ